MLKSGRKRAQRIHEHNERVRRIEAEIAFMEMISKNRTDIVLNLKKGYLCTNSNVDSKQMYVLKNDLVASGDIRLPNSTILEIEKVDEDRNLITVNSRKILDTPNDAELGAKVREMYWESKK